MNLMNPSPDSGWGLFERKSFFSRLKIDGFLALALMHHLCITSNVPLEYLISLLRDIAPSGVLEWMDKKDPMVQFLLRNRDDIFPEYNWEKFSSIVPKYFSLADVVPVNGGTRRLCLLKSNS